MAGAKPKQKKAAAPKLLIRSLALTPETEATLQRLRQEASDSLGWTVSGSAIVRALLQHAQQQGAHWARATLFLFIERERASGMVWGEQK